MNREHGFILVEIITILLIVGILVNAWLPNYYAIKKKAQAARIIGDFLVIRDAVTMYYSDYGDWPESSGWGRSPQASIDSCSFITNNSGLIEKCLTAR